MTSFASIDHPAFQNGWLLRSLDEIFEAAGDRLDVVSFCIDGERGIEDKTATYVGSIFLEPGNANGLAPAVIDSLAGSREISGLTEDEKDHIPAMRRMERMIENMGFQLPMAFDVDGDKQGDWSLSARRDNLLFMLDQREWEDGGVQLRIGACLVDGTWTSFTQARYDLSADQDVSLDEPQALFEEFFDADGLHVDMRTVISASIESDEPDSTDSSIGVTRTTGGRQIVFTIADDSFTNMRQPEDED